MAFLSSQDRIHQFRVKPVRPKFDLSAGRFGDWIEIEAKILGPDLRVTGKASCLRLVELRQWIEGLECLLRAEEVEFELDSFDGDLRFSARQLAKGSLEIRVAFLPKTYQECVIAGKVAGEMDPIEFLEASRINFPVPKTMLEGFLRSLRKETESLPTEGYS